MKKKNKIKLSLLVILIIWVSIASSQKYKYPPKKELEKKVNYLERVITSPLDRRSEIMQVGTYSGEFMFFALSYSCYALTNISFLDSSFTQKAIPIIDSAIQKAMDEKIYVYYASSNPISPKVDSSASVLFLGHLNLMLGCYRTLSPNDKYDALNDSISKSLHDRYLNSKSLNLCSYPEAIWIPDNTVALASLKLHSQNTGSNYDTICKKWVERAKKDYTEEKTKVLFSTIDYHTAKPLEEPRGSMLGWSIYFIYRFDADYAKELYNNYKKYFSNNLFVLRLFKERHNKRTFGAGDIDSGPLVFGYSIPANAFAFASAVAFKDRRNARRLQRLIKIGSKEKKSKNEISYKIRFTKENYSPMAEALILFSETMTEWRCFGFAQHR